MITLYGISNCDTIRKARKWLGEHGVDFHFHDYRKDGVDESRLRQWCDELGFEALLNKRGTTWRGLSETDKADLNTARAIRIMIENPTVIKRPVLENGGEIMVGFDQSRYQSLL